MINALQTYSIFNPFLQGTADIDRKSLATCLRILTRDTNAVATQKPNVINCVNKPAMTKYFPPIFDASCLSLTRYRRPVRSA